MDINMVIGVVGVVIGAASLVYAIMVNRRMADRDTLVRAQLRSFAGDMEQICTSADWAYQHFGAIQTLALNLNQSQDVKDILKSAQLGSGDSVAAKRMIRNFLNQVLTLQEGMFQTRDITHIDRAKQDQKDTH